MVFGAASVAYALFALFIVRTNRYQLPFTCEIFFLSVKGNTFNWVLNYILQSFMFIFGAIFYISRFILMLILMNQSSWFVEAAILKVNQIDNEFQKGPQQFDKFLGEIVEEIGEVIEWLTTIRIFFRRFFLAYLTILATVLCLYFYSMMIGGHAEVILNTELTVIFLLCRMGSKLNSELSKLSAAIYSQNWHLLSVSHQKDLNLMLQMSQNIEGFDGVFKAVDLATFQKV